MTFPELVPELTTEKPSDSKSAMNPAVGRQHIFIHCIIRLAIYGIAEILLRRH